MDTAATPSCTSSSWQVAFCEQTLLTSQYSKDLKVHLRTSKDLKFQLLCSSWALPS